MKKIIYLFVFLVCLASAFATVPEYGLVSHWALNDSNSGVGNVTNTGNITDWFGTNNGIYSGRTFNHGVISGAVYRYGKNVTGVVSSASWVTNCQYEGCLGFDGINDYVTIPDSSSLDVKSITHSMWVKGDVTGSANYGKLGAYGFHNLYTDGRIQFYAETSSGASYSGTYDSNYNDGEWHNIVGTYDSATGYNAIYQDGVFLTGQVYSGITGDIVNSANSLIIGKTASTYFNGSIDEVKILDRALNQTEITELYENNYLSNPKPGEISFSFDEGTGSKVYSSSQLGSALEFDGINDKIIIPHSSELNVDYVSMSMWLKPKLSLGTVISKDDRLGKSDLSYNLLTGTNLVQFGYQNRTGTASAKLGCTATANEWSHIIITHNTTNYIMYVNNILCDTIPNIGTVKNNALNLIIGANDESGLERFYNGSIDEVAIYNRSLSQTEITELYTAGIPTDNNNLLAYYDFNEGSGAVAYDQNQLTKGVLNTNPSKRGMGFDGIDDNITTADIDVVSSFTLTAWAKPNKLSGLNSIISKWWDGSQATWDFRQTGAGLELRVNDGSDKSLVASNVFTINEFTFITGIYNTTHLLLYADGIFLDSLAVGTLTDNTADVKIGDLTHTSAHGYFNGSIANVRIYNRSLTSQEVYIIYNQSGFNSSYLTYTPTNLSLNVSEGDEVTFTATSSITSDIKWFLNGVYQTIGNVWTWFVGVHDEDNYNEILAVAENETTGDFAYVMWTGTTNDKFPLVPYSISPTGGVYDTHIPITCFINDSASWFKNSTFDFQVHFNNGSGYAWRNATVKHDSAYYSLYTLDLDEQDNVSVRCRSYDGLNYSAWSNTSTDISVRHKQFKFDVFDATNIRNPTIYTPMSFNAHCKFNDTEDLYKIKNIYADCNGDGLWDDATAYEDTEYFDEDYLSYKCRFDISGEYSMSAGCVIEKLNSSKEWTLPTCIGLGEDETYCVRVKEYRLKIGEGWE